jgi:hypothetical protein
VSAAVMCEGLNGGRRVLLCGVPTSPPCGDEGLGDELGSEFMTSVVLDPCGDGQIVRSSVLLAAGYWHLGA